MKKLKAVIFRSDRDRQFYARIVASNGKTMFITEGYRRIASAQKALQALIDHGLWLTVEIDNGAS